MGSLRHDLPLLLLTDAPDAARPLLAPGSDWRRVDPVEFEPKVRDAWHAIAADGPDGALWCADGAGVAPPRRSGARRVVLVVDDAPRSQFDVLNERLASGVALPSGLVCVALSGARFHGQRGRPWVAHRGNLHVSVHLPLDVDAAEAQPGLTALPAVAAARAIERLTEGRVVPTLKWVNDVLVDERKVGGVLVATQVHADRVRHAVVGVGINLVRAPDLPVSPRVVPPVALGAVDPAGAAEGAWARLLVALVDELERGRALLRSGDGDHLVAAFRSRSAFLGRVVTIWPSGDDDGAAIARGRVLELLPDLSLRLEGVAEPVRGGRMTLDALPVDPVPVDPPRAVPDAEGSA
jgi:biotin-[acetyl-CoA-carboxylase] ligase BirA-like protein